MCGVEGKQGEKRKRGEGEEGIGEKL